MIIKELKPLLDKYNTEFVIKLENLLINSNFDKSQRDELVSILLSAEIRQDVPFNCF